MPVARWLPSSSGSPRPSRRPVAGARAPRIGFGWVHDLDDFVDVQITMRGKSGLGLPGQDRDGMPAERVDRQREVSATARAQHFCLPVSLQGLLEPDAVKVASPVCAVRRVVVSPAQPGGTRREVSGSPGLPGRESARGQEHAREAVAVWRRPGRGAARPARYGQGLIA